MKSITFTLVGLVVLAFMLAACGGPANSGFPTGKFIKEGTDNYGLIFNEDGTFTVFSGAYTMVRATYTVEGNVLTETSNNGGCETNVNFNYTFDGSKLAFTYVGNPEDDACEGRRADFNNVAYTLAE